MDKRDIQAGLGGLLIALVLVFGSEYLTQSNNPTEADMMSDEELMLILQDFENSGKPQVESPHEFFAEQESIPLRKEL